jgi:hypothetical protein
MGEKNGQLDVDFLLDTGEPAVNQAEIDKLFA